MVGERADAGMRGDDRRARRGGGGQHGGARGVRHVDQQAEPVHLGDRLPPEGGEPAMLLRGVAEFRPGYGRVGQRVVAVMGQRDVAGAARRQRAQPGEVGAESVAVLDRGDDRGGVIPPGALDVVGGAAEPRLAASPWRRWHRASPRRGRRRPDGPHWCGGPAARRRRSSRPRDGRGASWADRPDGRSPSAKGGPSGQGMSIWVSRVSRLRCSVSGSVIAPRSRAGGGASSPQATAPLMPARRSRRPPGSPFR